LLIFSILHLFFSLSLHSAESKNHLIVLGGGGEPKKESTLFDYSISLLGDFYQENNWKSTMVTFNGGHKTTEEILKKFKSPNKPFTEESFLKVIEQYSQKIKNGEISTGEQIIIFIAAHGSEKNKNELTHSIATTGKKIEDYDHLSGSSLVGLDQLRKLTELANHKKIKTAIIDLSCHSGNTLALANKRTCVISSTGPNHYGYSSLNDWLFVNRFSFKMRKGRNLEDIFLEARNRSTDASYPMISTPENQAILKLAYHKLGPYMYSFDPDANKLSPYLLSNLTPEASCKRDDAFSEINKTIDKIEKLNTLHGALFNLDLTYKKIDFEELKKTITEYKQLQDLMILKLKEMNTPLLQKKEKIVVKEGDIKLEIEQSWGEMLTSDYEKWIKKSQGKINKNVEVKENKLLVKLYQMAKLKTEKIKEKVDLHKINETMKFFEKNSAYTKKLALKIAEQEKTLYDALYKEQRKSNGNKTNACKDFIL
jgi:hypothetical protein